jgi:protocatechuate 3,4-dioxygenase beta subunit
MSTPDRLPAAILNRRAAVTGSIVAATLGSFGLRSAIAIARESETIATPDALICVLTPEMTEGPFYVDDDLIRTDITDGQPGLPLELAITVVDTTTCAPLANVAVDIWHCNAQGYYSGVEGANPGGNADQAAAADASTSMFLRGTQITGADGVARFTTIYPGWYQGRTVHIHLKVISGGAESDSYDGGTDIHIGQLFFDDATSDAVYAVQSSYAGRDDTQRTRNDRDGILGDHAGEPGFFIVLSPVDEADAASGYAGAITVGVTRS